MKVICLTSHIVDEDDDGNIRTVRNGEEAEVLSFDTKSGYHIGVPHNGATGFYQPEEFKQRFRFASEFLTKAAEVFDQLRS